MCYVDQLMCSVVVSRNGMIHVEGAKRNRGRPRKEMVEMVRT